MCIENYIPEGRENAISREALGNIVGDDRVARKMIEDARCNVVIINLQDGKGYYLPPPMRGKTWSGGTGPP